MASSWRSSRFFASTLTDPNEVLAARRDCRVRPEGDQQALASPGAGLDELDVPARSEVGEGDGGQLGGSVRVDAEPPARSGQRAERGRGIRTRPKMDGRTVLKELKRDPELRSIPVVVLTTSKDDEDVYRSYDLGVNSYIVKPVTFEALVDILQTLEKYWFEIVELPPQPE